MAPDPTLLTPLLDAVQTDDDRRQVLVDWLCASWIRQFDPAEALDLATDVILANPAVYGIAYAVELVTRTLFRAEQLLGSPKPAGAAEGLMAMMLDVDERYLANLALLNTPLADGEG